MEPFNVVVVGVGGQGAVTLANVIEEAAFKQGFDVKGSEMYGLAQRGGSIPCHVRFGDKAYSSMIRVGQADLVIALEQLEALRASFFGSKEQKTVFVIDACRIIPVSVSVLKESYPEHE
jgi:indolepyruvate ferredoxin oxidoreductase, beta subunit